MRFDGLGGARSIFGVGTAERESDGIIDSRRTRSGRAKRRGQDVDFGQQAQFPKDGSSSAWPGTSACGSPWRSAKTLDASFGGGTLQTAMMMRLRAARSSACTKGTMSRTK